MARITDPSGLNQETEVVFDTSEQTIQLIKAGNLTDEGVTLQALYSFAKDEWRTDEGLIKYPFPFVAITGEQFELVNGWDFADVETKNLIRDAGWALRDTDGTTLEEYMNITSLGLFNDSATDKAYYLQEDGGVPEEIALPGEVNQAVQIFSAATLDDFNYRGFFRIYLREQGKTYGFYDLNVEQNIPELTFRKYALPLVNEIDLNYDITDTDIDSNGDGTADIAPYSGMSITYHETNQTRNIGGDDYTFDIIIDGNQGTAEQIYQFVQWSLRQPDDIDDGPGDVRGDTAEELLTFIGDTLQTSEGVYIDNFRAEDTNRLQFTDTTGEIREFPFVAAGNMVFNDNLQTDLDSKYFVFFTNDSAATTPQGNDFGTDGAILIEDNDGLPLTGDVGGNETISFNYDYDGNVQRGAGSDGTNAPFTAVAVGLNTAQYVVTTGNITRTTANVINFVAALERNYIEPNE